MTISRKWSENYIRRKKQLRGTKKDALTKNENMKVGNHILQEVQACERLSEYVRH